MKVKDKDKDNLYKLFNEVKINNYTLIVLRWAPRAQVVHQCGKNMLKLNAKFLLLILF